jgi:hypothetical protein
LCASFVDSDADPATGANGKRPLAFKFNLRASQDFQLVAGALSSTVM